MTPTGEGGILRFKVDTISANLHAIIHHKQRTAIFIGHQTGLVYPVGSKHQKKKSYILSRGNFREKGGEAGSISKAKMRVLGSRLRRPETGIMKDETN